MIFLLALGAWGACSASDQGPCPPQAATPSPEQVNAAAQGAKNRGFLWRISKGGHASYLYGTIHVARFEWIFPGRDLIRALRETDRIALEINPMDESANQALQQGIAASTATPLPQVLQDRIARLAQAHCVPAAALAPLRAEMQVATLAEGMARRDGLEPVYGIDLQLAVWAQSVHKPLESLETVQAQLAALLQPDNAQRLMDTQEALEELESGRERATLVKMAQAWADSDYQTLGTYREWCQCVNTDAEKSAMQRLLEARNPVIAQRLDQLHTSGHKVFAAVGALHMIDPLGLPTLMAQRGYLVQKLF